MFLARILPQDGPGLEVGDIADALYERANLYADEAYINKVNNAAIAEQTAEVLRHNAMNCARREAVFENAISRIPNPAAIPKHEDQTGPPKAPKSSIPNPTAGPSPIPVFGLPDQEGTLGSIPAVRVVPTMLPSMNRPVKPLPFGIRQQPLLTREPGIYEQPQGG